MSRLFVAAAAAAALLTAPARADGPSGFWKFRFADADQPVTLLFAFTEENGKWVGDFVGSSVQLRLEPKFSDVTVTDSAVKFTLKFGDREFVNFDGVLAKDGKKLSGSYSQFGGRLRLTDMYPSKLKKLTDPIELARENVTQLDPGPDLFNAGYEVADGAAAKKVPVEEVRGIADRLAKAAAGYGARWELTVSLRLASTLAGQKGYEDVALAQARRAERMLTDETTAATRLEVFETLARALTKADKPDEAKRYAAEAAKLVARDYAEYTKTTLNFPAEPLKHKGDRAVLVEIFTGAECPPCAGVDVAGDAVLKAYPPADVVLLQYHFHVPQPDPLTSPDGMTRVEFYGDLIGGAPTVMLNGKPGPEGGGPIAAGKAKFAELQEALAPLLEQPAGAKIALSVAKADKGYTAKATVTGLAAPGAKVVLRFALAEERVRYAGGNGIRYHHHVVRALPGGVRGFPLAKNGTEQTVAFDPEAIREQLTKYLDQYAKEERDFPRPDRPMALENLKLVAFVQNDATGEVLQAVQVDVK